MVLPAIANCAVFWLALCHDWFGRRLDINTCRKDMR